MEQQYLILREEPDGSYVVHRPLPTNGTFLAVPDDDSAWKPFAEPSARPKKTPKKTEES